MLLALSFCGKTCLGCCQRCGAQEEERNSVFPNWKPHHCVDTNGEVRWLTRLCLGPVSQFHLPEKAVGRHRVHESTGEILPLLPCHCSWEFRISQLARRSCPRPPASLTKYTLKCNFQRCFFLKILLYLVAFFAINLLVKNMPCTKTLNSHFCFSESCQFGCPEKNAVCHREPWCCCLTLATSWGLRVVHPQKGYGSTFCVPCAVWMLSLDVISSWPPWLTSLPFLPFLKFIKGGREHCVPCVCCCLQSLGQERACWWWDTGSSLFLVCFSSVPKTMLK